MTYPTHKQGIPVSLVNSEARACFTGEGRGHGLLRRVALDALMAVLLFFFGAYVARSHLDALGGETSAVRPLHGLYGPAVMLAGGRGFFDPDVRVSPELNAFLRGKSESLSVDALPPDIPEVYSTTAEYHRYLLYTVAFVWRILGVSWRSLEPLLAFLFGWCAVAIYGLMRLGMGRAFSLFLTIPVLLSPAMLGSLNELRDFSKAPFILSIIFLLAYLIRYRSSYRQTLFIAALTGVLTGVGLGFRQDPLSFVPASTVILAVAAGRIPDRSRRRRAGIVVLYLACFLFTGLPMLNRMEGSVQVYHTLIQGFSEKRLDNLGIAPAAYSLVASGQDEYVFATVYAHHQRVNQLPEAHFTLDSPGAARAGKQWLIDVGQRFPADLLARGYAGALRTLRYADGFPMPGFVMPPKDRQAFVRFHGVLALHLHRFGLLYALVALLLMGGAKPVLALGVLVFGLYVCGYISLQCEARHTFHLAFVPFWVLGFLLWNLPRRGVALLLNRGAARTADWKGFCRRMTLFSVTALLILFLPLYGLRLYQRVRVEGLMEPYARAEKSPLPVTARTRYGWTEFALAAQAEPLGEMRDIEALYHSIHGILSVARYPVWHTRTRYMAVEFDGAALPRWMLVRHAAPGTWNEFTQLLRLPTPAVREGRCFYYFPVHEMLVHDEDRHLISRNRFLGVALPETHAHAFRGLYALEETSAFRLLPLLMRSESGTAQPLYQQLRFFPDPADYYRAETEITSIAGMAEAAARYGHDEDAARFYGAALLAVEDSSQRTNLHYRLHLARALMALGQLSWAGDAAHAAAALDLAPHPHATEVLLDIAMQFQLRDETDTARAYFTLGVETAREEWADLLVHRADAFLNAGHAEFALERYREIILAFPDYEYGLLRFAAILEMRGAGDELIDALRDLTRAHPGSVLPPLRLGVAYEGARNFADAAACYAQAAANGPDHSEAAIRHLAMTARDRQPDPLKRALDQALDQAPALRPLAARALEEAADRLVESGDQEKAAALYALAAGYGPENSWILFKQATALLEAGARDTAQAMLTALLATESVRFAAPTLDRLLLDEHDSRARLDFWRGQALAHPHEAVVQQMYAVALWDLGDFDEALATLDSLPDGTELPPEICVRGAIARIAAGHWTPGADTAYLDCPGAESLFPVLLVQAQGMLRAEGRMDMADTLARAGVSVAPASEAAWLTLGAGLESAGQPEEALRSYRAAFPEADDTRRIAQRIDALCAQFGDDRQRLAVWREIHAEVPDNPVAALHLGMALEDVEHWADAAEVYRAAARDTDTGRPAALRLGGVLARLGQVDTGREAIEEAVVADPGLTGMAALVCGQTGNALLARGDAEHAVPFYQRALRYQPDDPLFLLALGDALHQLGDTVGAKEHWQRVVIADANGPAALEALRRLDALLDPEQRELLWRALLERLPDAIAPGLGHALALADRDAIDAALERCDALLHRHPDNGYVRLISGALLCRAGDLEQGLETVEAAVTRDPFLAGEAAGRLATSAALFKENHRIAEAEKLAAVAAALAPEDLSHHLLHGEILFVQERFDKAMEAFTRILISVPESPRTAELMDAACARMNDPDACRDAWQPIVEAHPEARIPREYLERATGLSAAEPPAPNLP